MPSLPRMFSLQNLIHKAQGTHKVQSCRQTQPFLILRGCAPPRFVTVISLNDNCASVEEAWLKDTIATFERVDDVFRKEFLSGIIFTGPSNVKITLTAINWLNSEGTTWIELVNTASTTSIPPPGPYCAFRERRLSHLPFKSEDIESTVIAVPSRLRATTSKAFPLCNWRRAVKDIFQIEGIKTSTAACIALLEDKGACIIGTTKLAAFAATEEPIECVDYQAPWNPRADGYQSPAGSSSGSGVAVASYEWVDIAIGSDTSGSGRRPGHWNGCFRHRTSHGMLPVEGYIPSFRRFDVPTFFGRDIDVCAEFATAWYGDKLASNQAILPAAIVYPIEYMELITNGDQRKIIDEFTANLEKSIGVKHEKVSFNEVWNAKPPEEAKGESLQEYMKDASRNSFFYDDYHHFDKFREDYHQKFSKTPYVSPPVRWQWKLSATISKDERDVAVHRLEVYREWCSREILRVGKYDTVILIPIENISPRYRDEPLGKLVKAANMYFNPVGVPMLFPAPILKAPEFTVPIGQVPFQSKVTGNVEELPVAISLLSAPGRDLKLMEIARDCLVRAGRPTNVLPGNKLFP
ncbi:amidase signature domain-containing protein [Bisporella sp. PMI_857]|nr:amidase signature domain-containing protein [Bisporella sp. PMI_857]